MSRINRAPRCRAGRAPGTSRRVKQPLGMRATYTMTCGASRIMGPVRACHQAVHQSGSIFQTAYHVWFVSVATGSMASMACIPGIFFFTSERTRTHARVQHSRARRAQLFFRSVSSSQLRRADLPIRAHLTLACRQHDAFGIGLCVPALVRLDELAGATDSRLSLHGHGTTLVLSFLSAVVPTAAYASGFMALE